ncbi:hypothetical protein AB0H49_06520 [Nocardia sp. NPDC050713]|uniref:hypothetical protein n=1 Tax=Nocardia sp. NPDC050713 TaxID=3154511 RepID=UPI0033D4808F
MRPLTFHHHAGPDADSLSRATIDSRASGMRLLELDDRIRRIGPNSEIPISP